jgi:beta-galactosidase
MSPILIAGGKMKTLSRREMLKAGLIAPAAVAAATSVGPLGVAMEAKDEMFGMRPDYGMPEPAQSAFGRERLLLDFGWRFHLGHANDSAKDFGFGSGMSGSFQKTGNFLPACAIAFNDEEWTSVDLPHDWAIELPFKNDPALQSKGFYPLGRKYPETSVGWYRRVFDLPQSDAGKRITIEFDGSYRESMVILNGFYIGRHSGGYDPFSFDVTDFANPGGRNVLLVRVDATLSDGWFYEGAGLYRHVWLVKTSPVHVKKWGTFVKTEVKSGEAGLSIRTEVNNHGKGAQNVRVVSTVLDPSGKEVAGGAAPIAPVAEGKEQTYEQELTVKRPQLWSLEERNLYKLVTELRVGSATVDRYETTFGIRTVEFDSARGFLLNGKPVKLKGTCNHQDHAGVGAAVPDAVQYYRIARLQDMGCNSVRTSHNPPTSELLDACDRMGILVFDETRMMSSNNEGMSQFANLIRRDRNRPCVFMWSMGNEEGQANTDKGVLILGAMKSLAKQLDGTRPVSIAPTGAIGTGGLALGDVFGYNYMDPGAEAFHKAHPDKPVMGTETVSAVGTRGIYITDPSKGFVASYDPYTTSGRASAEGWWSFCNARPWLSGGFIWTGFDYRGEPSPNGWPNIGSQYGIIDTCGFPKDSFFYYQSWWTDKPVLHLFPHWNWSGKEGKRIAVWAYSNLDKVELLVNGKSLGAKDVKKDSHVAWIVEYAPGVIEARGYKDGKVAMTTKRESTGAPAQLAIKADTSEMRADGEDVAMFAVEVRDAQGRIVPITDNDVTFRITGAGKLIGTGNGDPTNQQPDKGTSRRAFSGLCMGVVQSTKSAGAITVEVSSPGLSSATATINTKAVTLRPQVAEWARTIPSGSGITGLWRPVRAQENGNEMLAFLAGTDSMVFTLTQQGSALTGTVEGNNISFIGGGDVPVPIEDGKVDGDSVTFKAGRNTYKGSLKGDRLELDRSIFFPWDRPKPSPPDPNAPDIGPAPDNSDPSIGSFHLPPGMPMVLQRAQR